MISPVEAMDEAVHQIVDEVHPLRIVVFGSVMRGEAGPDSDLDLLVVMPDGSDRLQIAYRLHHRLRKLGCAKDIVVALQSDVEAMRDNPTMIIHTAFTEGKVVYDGA
ncbi:MAG TPA: nucleotidyltransferase domain-containing protein [Candidatus Bathyarchaeia archaeon]|nr:nucleotidyltransferase domain-containing protein [Candidatus Bathyarchaeia archaeon]